jgi:hypothetical protein
MQIRDCPKVPNWIILPNLGSLLGSGTCQGMLSLMNGLAEKSMLKWSKMKKGEKKDCHVV